ncbi:MAG: hypothetical protein U1E05_27070 [Patescibacteria group bacterium]|nr:hypothetical protein [Patescibacteria group bacterium]
MSNPDPVITIPVDLTNPGQFFACCGLLELADRLWQRGAQGWFEQGQFRMAGCCTLDALIEAIAHAELTQVDPENNTSSPIVVGKPFRSIRLDWWLDDRSGGKELKVWAGTMESVRIAKAMQFALRNEPFREPGLLDVGVIAYDPDNSEKKVEPYYFDARRAPNAHSRDVGFSPNDLGLTMTAYPAVELLCLIGLQCCLPARTPWPRVYDYFAWPRAIPADLLRPMVAGAITLSGLRGYRFENWYRTGQKKHKAFRSAIPLPQGE